jgi:hypothetical protein
VALRDEGSLRDGDEDTVEAGNRQEVTAPTEAFHVEEHNDAQIDPADDIGANDEAELAETIETDDEAVEAASIEVAPTAVTAAPPTAGHDAASAASAADEAHADEEAEYTADEAAAAGEAEYAAAGDAADADAAAEDAAGQGTVAESTLDVDAAGVGAPVYEDYSIPAEPSVPVRPSRFADYFTVAEPVADAAPTLIDMIPRVTAPPREPANTGAANTGAANTGAAYAGNGNWTPPSATARGGRRPPWMIATAAGAAAVIAITLIIVAVSGSSHPTTAAPAADARHLSATKTHKTAPPVTLTSVTPSDGSTSVNGADPITVTYSGKPTTLPTITPSISGSWKVDGDKAIFTPDIGYKAGTHVTVHAAGQTVKFTTGQYSTVRLEQLLSQLGYLPVTWTPSSGSTVGATDANAQLSAAYDPPAGSFSFNSGYPTALTSQWSVGTNNNIVSGAVRTFEYNQGLTMDGVAGPAVWNRLLRAVATGQRNESGYTYVYVNQGNGSDEYLKLYHNGRLYFTTPVNTGIAGRSTADGTYPVYERLSFQIMQGTNPDGSKYADPVHYISYFNGSDAVHYFVRASYGWYQSLGCVETPQPYAEEAYNLMTYGTLVTVTGAVA